MEVFKRQAAEYAANLVKSGMVVGLGHGSTALYAVQHLAKRLKDADVRNVLGVPCSSQVQTVAHEIGIPLTTLEAHPLVDLTIDGADEVTHDLSIIKGGGGALLWEKIVAQASKREIIVVDESKLTEQLGTRAKVPVEVIPFGWTTQMIFLQSIAHHVERRILGSAEPWLTDQGNYILDCDFGPIAQPAALAEMLKARTGIVEHGLFIHLVSEVIVAGPGGIQRLLLE